MKKLIYLIVAIAILGLVVVGCIPVVPPIEQSEPTSLTRQVYDTYYVTTTGNDTTGDGSEDYPWATITHAIGQATSGDTIIVAAGTYTDDIWDSSLGTPDGYRITESVTLLGAQAGVDPAGSTDRGGETILVRTNGLPYSLYVSDITIDGFMFGSSDPNTGGRLIIADDADDVIIRNCIIQNTPSGSSGHGVYIYPGADNALIEYNTFYNTAWEAIASWQASGAVISHNYISSSGQHAIQMMGHAGSNNEISYNHISGIVAKNAIQYWGGPGATITHNVIDGDNTMFDGIWLDYAADGSTVSNNKISDTIYAGINVREDCANAVITYNDISDCGTGVDVVGIVTGIVINFNEIYGNVMGVANYGSTDTVDAKYNWWGDVSGPYDPLDTDISIIQLV
jgi:parallel beta-helix repeat protein